MNRRIARVYGLGATALATLSVLTGCGGISGSNIHSGTSQSASPGSPTTDVDLNVTLNAAAPIGGSYTTPLEMVYDANGGAQDVDFVFSRTGLNTWKFDVEKPIGNATLLPQGQDVQLQFATNGSLDNIKVTNPDGSVLNENKVPVTGGEWRWD